MVWLNKNAKNSWGYQFEWTSEHMTGKQMYPMKYTYDIMADECLERLDEISPPYTGQTPRSRSRASSDKSAQKAHCPRDLYALVRENAQKDEKIGSLWDQVNTIPGWVDWDQISRGQNVFYRYGGASLTALAFQSLLGGMGTARVVEVLGRTGGFSTDVARHRLLETTQHILQVTQSLDAIQPGGIGHVSSVRVRLLHATVRRRIMKLAEQRPGYYNIETYGIPISDLDCIGTVGSFCSALIWIGLPRQGIFLKDREKRDLIALWRLVAWYMGTPAEYFESLERAKATLESILLEEINPSKLSGILANNIIACLQGQPPTFASKEYLTATARWLNGDQLSDALGLIYPSVYYKLLVAGQCIFFMSLSYTTRTIPFLDKLNVKRTRKTLYKKIVNDKDWGLGSETIYDFKYVPTFNLTTKAGKPKDIDLKRIGSERRSIRTLIIFCVVTAMLFYGAGKLVCWIGVRLQVWRHR